MRADDDGRDRADIAGRGRDGHEAGKDAVDHVAGVVLADRHLGVGHRGDGRRSASEHRDDGDFADAQVAAAAGAERRARVEPEPAEGKDERADGGHVEVVAGHGVGRAVLVVLAEARPQHDRAGDAGEAADHVDNTGAGEVNVGAMRGRC